MDFDQMRKKMSNGRHVSVRDAHRHRAMRVLVGEVWEILIYGPARLPADPIDSRQRIVRLESRQDRGLRHAISASTKYRVPFENIEIELRQKTRLPKPEAPDAVDD